MMNISLSSAGIKNKIIKRKYGKHSFEIINGVPQKSFPLCWHNYPTNTRSFALVFIDYDNFMEDGFPWLHWCVANIPAEINELPENCSIEIKKIDHRIIQGKNSWISLLPSNRPECNRYGGPAPEKFAHEYEITLYALNSYLLLQDGFYYNDFLKMINDKVLAKTSIFAKYFT